MKGTDVTLGGHRMQRPRFNIFDIDNIPTVWLGLWPQQLKALRRSANEKYVCANGRSAPHSGVRLHQRLSELLR